MVGKNGDATRAALRDAQRAEMRRLEAQPVAVARAVIRANLGTAEFARFKNGERIARGGEEWPVAILDAARSHELGFGARVRVVRLSSETVATHPRFKNFDTRDWRRVQRILHEGSVFTQPDNRRRFEMEFNNRLWIVAVKMTQDNDALYLLTILKKSSKRKDRKHRARK